jgi:hypothetical protein
MGSSGRAEQEQLVRFGPFSIRASEQVFVSTALSMGLVNLKPVVPGASFRCTAPPTNPVPTRCVLAVALDARGRANAGHVLVIPRRVVKRFHELNAEEVTDLW